MSLFLEQPLVLLGVGAGVLAVLFIALQQTGKRHFLWAMVAAAVIVAGLVALERLVVTPREQVRAVLHDIAAAAEANDIDAVCSHLSRRNPELEVQARGMLAPVVLERVAIKRIFDVEVKPDDKPPHAMVRIRALAVGGDKAGMVKSQRFVRDFEIRFVQEDGQWKVRHYEGLDPREMGF